MSPTSKPRPSEDERLMALLALDSQESPADVAVIAPDLAKLDSKAMSSDQISALHAYLDAHPEAFEAVLQRHSAESRRRISGSRSWQGRIAEWLFPVPRYAAAFCACAVVAVVASLMWIASQDLSSDGVERAYAELAEHVPPQTLVDTVNMQSQGEARLGFSEAPRPSDAAAASFAAGFAAGRRQLLESTENVGDARTNESMFVLGQWNALLWAAAVLPEPLPAEFWKAQQARFEEFAAEIRRQRRVDPVVIVHIQRIESLLSQLSQRHSARAAYELSQELRLFRTRYVP